MKIIELNHWFVKKDELSISLMRHHVSIRILRSGKNNVYQLKVIDSNREELIFNFYTLEDAISFTEDVISKCYDNKEIVNNYISMFNNNDLSDINGLKVKDEKIELSKIEVLNLITSYYGEGKDYDVTTRMDLSLEKDQINIKFSIVENFDGITNIIRLTEGDLENVFRNYLNDTSYVFVDFKYMGGIRRVGYFVDEDKPYFNEYILSSTDIFSLYDTK
jgi:hypothetical protein